MAEGSNIVRIDPDLSRAFPDSAAVNEALRALLRIAERSARKPYSPARRRISSTSAGAKR
jgi:hypothetical protein